MKILYANGCSTTWGEELHPKIRENSVWPAIFAKEVGIPVVENHAICGGSNERIFRTTLDYTSKYLKDGKNPEDLFLLIGWTDASRREFFNTVSNKWQSFLANWGSFPTREDKLMWAALFPDFVDYFKDFEKMLTQIITLQDFLLKHNFKFYFVSCLGDFTDYLDEIDHYMRLIDPKYFMGLPKWVNFTDWSKERKLGIGFNNHPLEDSHREWGKFVAENWLNTEK